MIHIIMSGSGVHKTHINEIDDISKSAGVNNMPIKV